MASFSPRTVPSCSNWLGNAAAKLYRSIYRQAEYRYKKILDKLKLDHKKEIAEVERLAADFETQALELQEEVINLKEKVKHYENIDAEMSNKYVYSPPPTVPVTKEKNKKRKKNKTPVEDILYDEIVAALKKEKVASKAQVTKKGKNLVTAPIITSEKEDISFLKDVPPSAILRALAPTSPQTVSPVKKRERSVSPPSSNLGIPIPSFPLNSTNPEFPPLDPVNYFGRNTSKKKKF